MKEEELIAIVLEVEELTVQIVLEGEPTVRAESLRLDDLDPSVSEVFLYSHTQIHFRVH